MYYQVWNYKTKKAMFYFGRINRRYPNIKNEILDCLAEHTSPETSISLRAFVDKFKEHTGKEFPMHRCTIRSTEFLLSLDYTACYRAESGMPYFFRIEPFK